MKCASSSARLGAKAVRLVPRNTIRRRFGNGRKSREQGDLQSTRRRANEGPGRVKTAGGIRENTRFGYLVDSVFRPIRQKAARKGRLKERSDQALRQAKAASTRRQETARTVSQA